MTKSAFLINNFCRTKVYFCLQCCVTDHHRRNSGQEVKAGPWRQELESTYWLFLHSLRGLHSYFFLTFFPFLYVDLLWDNFLDTMVMCLS